jgi:D-alanyl-D-alanine carboxypeptidase
MVEPARTVAGRTRSTSLASIAVVSMALVGVLVCQSLASSSTAASPIDVIRSEHPSATREADRVVPDSTPVLRSQHRGAPGEPGDLVPDGPPVLRSEHRGALGEADGVVPDGTTVLDDEIPGVAKLDPELLSALRQAATDAADDGVEFVVESGWRSPEYQARLLQEAVSKYGSEEEAARWVATPDTSAHVTGDAVDIGQFDARAWLSEHGAEYGLCQIYRNEPWHYELRPEAIDHGCSPMYADTTHDPRMPP